MAWASVGTFGSGNSTSAGTTVDLTASDDVEVDNVAVVLVATDNASTSDGNTSEVTSVVDDAGNTWTKAREFCNGQGGAAAGATVAIFYCIVVNQITAGDIITATISASKLSKAILGWEFTRTAGSTLSVEGSGDLANDAADPGSIAISSLASHEYLFVRAIASESSTATLLTVTSSHTTMGQAIANPGTSATSMAIRGEFRILTGTGDTSDPTLFSADHASTFVAIKATDPVASGQPTAVRSFGIPHARPAGFGGVRIGG